LTVFVAVGRDFPVTTEVAVEPNVCWLSSPWPVTDLSVTSHWPFTDQSLTIHW